MTPSPDDLAGKVREAWAATLPSRTDSPYRNQFESALAALLARAEEWLAPFDGDGIEWHESLPDRYTYQASDFSKLVSAVHAYECRVQAAEDALRVAREGLRQLIRKGEKALPKKGVIPSLATDLVGDARQLLAAIPQAEDGA